MTFIYSFLRKRKMHENQYGIIMVVIAYALSVLLLVLGSDVFYNIKSAAAGMNADTEEETQMILKGAGLLSEADPSLTIRTNLLNPYGIADVSEAGKAASVAEDDFYRTDTAWFRGSAMDIDNRGTMIEQMSSYAKQMKDENVSNAELGDSAIQTDMAEKVSSKADTSGKAADTSEHTVEASDKSEIDSFSVEVAAGDTVITVSAEEVTMLERIVAAEAEGEDMVGKILIANVVFNRIADEEFPDSVEEVIFQKSHGDYQFSPVDNGRYWDVEISDETEEAVMRALDGEDYSKGALYFIARKRTSSESARWFDDNLDWLFRHGGHEFYK